MGDTPGLTSLRRVPRRCRKQYEDPPLSIVPAVPFLSIVIHCPLVPANRFLRAVPFFRTLRVAPDRGGSPMLALPAPFAASCARASEGVVAVSCVVAVVLVSASVRIRR